MKAQLFKTGEQIPETGVYRVIHAAHRLAHECTLIEGHTFPRCCKCGEVVEFECIATAPNWEPGPTHTIILYELPEFPPEKIGTEEGA